MKKNVHTRCGKSFCFLVVTINFGCTRSPDSGLGLVSSSSIILAPSNLSATTRSSSQIELSWQDNSNNEDGFKLDRSTDGTVFSQIRTLPSNTTAFLDEGLTDGTQYFYRVRAYDANGTSEYSNTAGAITLLPAPSALAVTSAVYSLVSLTWQDNSANEDGFTIERSTDGTNFAEIATVSKNTLIYPNSGLNESSTYWYRVFAYNTLVRSECSNIASVTTPLIMWAKTYEEANPNDYTASFVQQTGDGGYIVAGETYSFGTYNNFWLMKLDAEGTIAWQKRYGGGGYYYEEDARQTSDGGYIMAGIYNGGYNGWVLKLNSNGTIAWQKRYSRVMTEIGPYSIQQTSDGGYVMAGSAWTGTGGHAFVSKLNNDGSIFWQKAYGYEEGRPWFSASKIQQTGDGGYIMAGFSESSSDLWMAKLGSDGTINWQKKYGGTSFINRPCSLQRTNDGGYIVAGSVPQPDPYSFYRDVLVIKLASNGTITWQKKYGIEGPNENAASSIQQTSDGGFIVTGRTNSFGAGSDDVWLLKLDATGSIAWQKVYGGINNDRANYIHQTSNGGFIIAGSTESFSGGGVWVMRLAPGGIINFNPSSGASTADSSVTGVDTFVAAVNTTATVMPTTLTTIDSNAVTADTAATIVHQEAP